MKIHFKYGEEVKIAIHLLLIPKYRKLRLVRIVEDDFVNRAHFILVHCRPWGVCLATTLILFQSTRPGGYLFISCVTSVLLILLALNGPVDSPHLILA